ncbi:MAG TPA: STAS domain-containing protein [Victivallales bacterium]|nr:STAS domain-containing protein [Victivallales bacterium]
MKAKILIANENGQYHIKVEGRATFEVSSPLRNLARRLSESPMAGVYVNLESCSGMDSTFIGVVAMLGLHAKKQNVPAVILNSDESNKKLLNGLGLSKIFTYTEDAYAGLKKWSDGAPTEKVDALDTAKTVLSAHETLMGIDESNVPRFKNVVEFVKKDIEKTESQDKK